MPKKLSLVLLLTHLQIYIKHIVFQPNISGKVERQCVDATVSFWCILRVCEAERAGMSQHRVDRWVYIAKEQIESRQLH